ncbi:programmed cell death protein 7 [Lampris incognitus]|uniref:programmed cell death protein 7 n=1 Tax=Lampris incognitus TaxID=2546036 RepID=UPI0024B5A7B5|nr:programmed cell death protein 7 [Lampris incognitus]
MDNSFHLPPSSGQSPYQEAPPGQSGSDTSQGNTPNNPSHIRWSSQKDPANTCHQWEFPPVPPAAGYSSHPHGFRPHLPPPPLRLESYGACHMARGFPSDPPGSSQPFSQLPPTVGTFSPDLYQGRYSSQACTQAGPPNYWLGEIHSTMGASGIQSIGQNSTANLSSGPPSSQYDHQPVIDPDPGFRHQHKNASKDYGGPLHCYPSFSQWVQDSSHDPVKAADTQSVDEKPVQRRQDEQWIKRFLQKKASKIQEQREPYSKISAPQVRDLLHGAFHLVSKLSLACEILKQNLENESVWADSYRMALSVKRELQDNLKVLDDHECLDYFKRKLACIGKRRARQHKRKLLQMEDESVERKIAEKEAVIDKWRMKQIHEVEEKKREQELKVAADSVLCEVRKKQADVKRMQDILRSLEKLRKLRKEAASRKGIFPDKELDTMFIGQLDKLKTLIGKRTSVYLAEENALRVMLEGEQEEERKKDLEKRNNKEKERQLQRKKEIETMLFGVEMHADHLLRPFREYYTQAEYSLPALLQIRREWDVFLTPVDHPDGTEIPQVWVIPEAPSDRAWASALDEAEST